MADLILKLGPFVFKDFEVPESLPFGGDQNLVVQQLIGGKRVIDSMGGSERDLEWTGIFMGAGAIYRAQALDVMRDAGKPLDFTFGQMNRPVVISSFEWDLQKGALHIPYRIHCVVAPDPKAPPRPSVDSLLAQDQAAVAAAAAKVNNPALTGKIAAIASAIGKIASVANAAAQQITSARNAILNARATVQSLIQQGEAIFNGDLLNAPQNLANVLTTASDFATQVSTSRNLPILRTMDSTLNRMNVNLTSGVSLGKTVTVAHGNLYQFAAENYGDPSEWTTIARANNLTDPFISGAQTLIIPATPSGLDGLPNE